MESLLLRRLIPLQEKGKETDVEHSITLDTKEEAQDAFKRAWKRMLNINIWHKLSGFVSADFVLKDEHAINGNRLAKVGDYLQIDIPGPGPASGDGYDWVRVDDVGEVLNNDGGEESVGMRVRSCKNPGKDSNETAHFFTSDATSTFIINRNGNTVIAAYHGRNEELNTDTKKLGDKIRNTVVGTSGLMGVSELQWSRLMKSFLEREV